MPDDAFLETQARRDATPWEWMGDTLFTTSLVGPEIAAHCAPQTLTEGELLIIAESTAWATQLRLMAPTWGP